MHVLAYRSITVQQSLPVPSKDWSVDHLNTCVWVVGWHHEYTKEQEGQTLICIRGAQKLISRSF